MDDQGLETTTRRTRNIGSRVCHCLLIVPLLAVVVLASVSLGIFVAKKNEINGNTIFKDEQHGSCILYATYKGASENPFSFHLGSEIACNLSIWGEGALAVLGALLAVGMIIKAVAGVQVLNLLLFFELPIIGICLLGGLAFAVNTTIGLAMTCDVYQKNLHHGSGSCTEFTLGAGGPSFYDSILESEVAAWLAAAVLLLLFVIYVVLMVAYCRHIHNWRSPKYSHFPEETVQSQNHFDYGTTKSTNPFD